MSTPTPTVIRVEVIGGKADRASIVLDLSTPVTIGRSSQNRLSIANPTVSRRHAVIEASPSGRPVIKDLGSLAGTKRRGKPIPGDGSSVRSGDEFDLGSARIRVTLDPATHQPALDNGPASGRPTRPTPGGLEHKEFDTPGSGMGSVDAISPITLPARWAGRTVKKETVLHSLGNYGIVAPEDSPEDGEELLAAIETPSGRRVTLRRISTGRFAWLARRRFLKDAQARMGTSHPNLLVPIDAGATAECLFLVVKRPAAIGIHRILRDLRGRPDMPPGVVALVGCGAAAAMAHLESVHGAGHALELVPRSILLTPDGDVLVRDLGLPSGAGSPADHRHLAPEAEAAPPGDLRASIFSLGIILYELLSGQPIDPGAKTTLRSIDTVRIDVGTHLARATMRALEVRPEDRFRGASEMAAALIQAADSASLRTSRPDVGVWIRQRYPEEFT